MLGANEIDAKIDTVQGLLRDRLGLRKRALPRMLQSAGRRLPKQHHAHLQALLEAQALLRNPKLAKQVDEGRVTQAYDAVTAHLRKVDASARRKDFLLKLAGTIAFNILLILAAFITWLWWRGYV